MRHAAALMLVAGLVARVATAQQQADSLLAYEHAAPRLLSDSLLRTFDGGIQLREVTYASPRGGRVGAYLVVPAGRGPFAAVLFGHWGLGVRTEFIPEALAYARMGVVSLLPDWPWTRAGEDQRDEGPLDRPEMDRDVHAQAVVDLWRGLDHLFARPDVDPARVGYVGHSYGAQFGAILGALDRRLRAVVLVGGIPDNATLLTESRDPGLMAYTRRHDPAVVQRYLAVNAPLDAVHWVGRIAPTPLLMQFAEYDRFERSSMERYAAAAREPKRVLWYPSGHELNDPRALEDRMAFVAEHLRLARSGAAGPR